MRHILLAILSIALLQTSATSSQERSDWQHWQFSRPIQIAPATEPHFARATLPLEVYGRAQESLADIRLVDNADNEVPYVLHAQRGERKREWRGTQLSDLGFVPGRYTEVLADTGQRDVLHNTLELQTDQKDFFTWAEVATSDDRKTWHIVRERAPVYRFEKDRLTGNQVVTYPPTRARWLRVRIQDTEKLFPVTACRVAQEVVEEAERVPLPMVPAKDSQAPQGEERWQMDLNNNLPASAVRFATTQEEFHRPVRISVSTDSRTWRDMRQGEIYRYRLLRAESPDGTLQRESLLVEFPETYGRYWRVSIFDRNDAPLAGLRLELMTTPRHLVFRQEPGRSYWVRYGNSRIATPQYDLTKVTQREELKTAPLAAIGKEEVNPRYTSPEPWSERHPLILWGALSFAVLVLAGLAVRSLHSTS